MVTFPPEEPTEGRRRRVSHKSDVSVNRAADDDNPLPASYTEVADAGLLMPTSRLSANPSIQSALMSLSYDCRPAPKSNRKRTAPPGPPTMKFGDAIRVASYGSSRGNREGQIGGIWPEKSVGVPWGVSAESGGASAPHRPHNEYPRRRSSCRRAPGDCRRLPRFAA